MSAHDDCPIAGWFLLQMACRSVRSHVRMLLIAATLVAVIRTKHLDSLEIG
jgi:hypothetical protein